MSRLPISESDAAEKRAEALQGRKEHKAAGKPLPWYLSMTCPACGGDWEQGGRYVPHAEDCWKYRKEREQQDRERAALSRPEAPMPISVLSDPHADWDCPCDRCENARRRALARAFGPMPGLAPKDRGGIE